MAMMNTNLAAAALLCCAALCAQTAPDRDQVMAVSKSFLRDSAELPMDVDVTTVVKDAKGKTKRNAKAKIRFLFKGYSGKSGNFSFHSTSGMFGVRVLHDSVGGNFAVIAAFTRLAPDPDGEPEISIDPEKAGEPLNVHVAGPKNCRPFRMSQKYLYPEQLCPLADFRMIREGTGLRVESFALDAAKLPAAGKVQYLGEGEIQRFHAEGELQEARLPDDPRPFLIPKRVTTTIATSTGTIVVTNLYTLRMDKKK